MTDEKITPLSEKIIDEICEIIDPNNTFLNECEKVVKERFEQSLSKKILVGKFIRKDDLEVNHFLFAGDVEQALKNFCEEVERNTLNSKGFKSYATEQTVDFFELKEIINKAKLKHFGDGLI